ncbi:MAG: DNA-binding protein [Lachnospiraceae bacterium]|nr:DNA-binding protein [Lachnospiraceae bacterium]
MDKIIERGLLFDFYGELLTNHQQKIYSEAVFNDLSLSELSEEEGISRQGIHDLIKRCDKSLQEYEDKLGLIKRFQQIKTEIENIEAIIESNKNLDDASKQELKSRLISIVEDL